ncbi:phosphoribosylanthranilate isomerase [Bacillus lacus]|uniref:N-(5'-phosphoribosyl)anthranilate isomerase n=1 Tax=Metabacillus lacus TaxID=1983721 RepID=A0A7X2IXL9_9BACI|nr:phosphoribosylanthranilate isomerase [Metabacillus lacus]MRX70993.1 phosphoribosylanthranilate isomerase [Metabacillus lacus]
MTRLKLCGNKSLEDLRVSSGSSKATDLGFIFTQHSKRTVSPGDAAKWLKEIPVKDKRLAGVFVNEEIEEILKVLTLVPLHVIQCHGTESAEQLAAIKNATGLEIWKALPHEEKTLEKMQKYKECADAFLIDCAVKGKWGGTGVSFDWSYVPSYMKAAEQWGRTCMIAGGVNPDNVSKLVAMRPHGIDLASGIEVNGSKDKELILKLEECL